MKLVLLLFYILNFNNLHSNAATLNNAIKENSYYYEAEYDVFANKTDEGEETETKAPLFDEENILKKYRKLIINDVAINLDDDEFNQNTDTEVYKAYYQDDLYFECDLPDDICKGNYDWSVNGFFLKLNEPAYTLILNKKINTNSTFLNVSCYFELAKHNLTKSLQFPLIHLGIFL